MLIRGSARAPPACRGNARRDAEFVALRDRVADAVGISRDAFRLLQQSEGKWDARANKWSDALDKAGNVIENGGKGAAQVVTSTFDEMKKKYPDLIKGDIHDVASNLMAGALYLREMAQQAITISARRSKPTSRDRVSLLAGSRLRAGFLRKSRWRTQFRRKRWPGSLLGRSSRGQVRRSRLESVPPVVPPTPPTPQEKQTVATEVFRKAQQDIIDSQQKAFADEDKLYEIFTRDLARAADEGA
jgi:hypothetical protein